MKFIILLILVWNILPPLICLDLQEVPWKNRWAAAKSMLLASLKGLVLLPIDLLAPVVVPIALLFTKPEDDRLPALFRWWDNDVSINGDQPEGAPTYYAEGRDRRSYVARFIWLAIRNRASWAALKLGYTYPDHEGRTDRDVWGDPLVGRDHAGWTLNRKGDVYQLYIVRRLGSKLCLRINFGHKIWAVGDGRQTAMVVNICFSILRWKGAA